MVIPKADLQALYETQEFQSLVRDLERERDQNLDERLRTDGMKLMARIQDTGPEAHEKLVSIMRYSDDPKLVAWIAKNFLDRAGFKAPKRAVIQQQHSLSPAACKNMVDAYRESFGDKWKEILAQARASDSPKELPESESDEDGE